MFSFEGFIRINTFLTGAYRLAYLNVLWIVTTVLGLGVLGAGPASYSLAKYVDGWFRHGETPPVTRTFVAGVREQPWRAMVVSWVLAGAGAIILTNVFRSPSWTMQALNVVALVVLGVAAAYVYPVMAATDASSVGRQLTSALLIGFGSLHWTIIGATAVGLTGWLMWQFALPLLVLFGVGIPACAVGVVTRIVFRPLAQVPEQPGTAASHRSSISTPATEQVA